ncbi:hypothetical protein [Polaromonas sp. CG9_12]|nr:hypothetical protein [Polaromonas sp. CG9_12]
MLRDWVSNRTPEDTPAFNAAFKGILTQRTRHHSQGSSKDIHLMPENAAEPLWLRC